MRLQEFHGRTDRLIAMLIGLTAPYTNQVFTSHVMFVTLDLSQQLMHVIAAQIANMGDAPRITTQVLIQPGAASPAFRIKALYTHLTITFITLNHALPHAVTVTLALSLFIPLTLTYNRTSIPSFTDSMGPALNPQCAQPGQPRGVRLHGRRHVRVYPHCPEHCE